jgi:tetratricopeptide (TPR) repeat protein
MERPPHEAGATDVASLYSALDDALADPHRRGKILHQLGRYQEAAQAFGDIRGTAEQEAWALFDRGKALSAAGQATEAIHLLQEAAARLPESPWPQIELGIALASQGQFMPARQRLEQAWHLDPPNGAVAFLLQRSAQRHLSRAAHYERQEQYALARRDYEAALILDPHNMSAHMRRSEALQRLGESQAAVTALTSCLAALPGPNPESATVRMALAQLRLAAGNYCAAKALLEQARRAQPHAPEIQAQLAHIQAAAAAANPLPLVRPLIQRVRAIPGWLGDDEAELLVALAWRAIARCAAAPVLVEIGSYCGRMTTLLALAAQSLGRMDARVVALDEPSLGPAPDGRSPRQALRANLAACGVAALAICAPEDAPGPWQAGCGLILVDGKHDYTSVAADVKRFAPYLHPGGLLAFHDYADYFPDVQRYVDELLLGDEFTFVAQAGSLIALTRGGNDHEPD